MGAPSAAVPGAPGRSPRPVWLWAVRLGALVALGASLHLLVSSLRGGPIAGCGGPGSGCERVLSTRWAFWLGVPVSALGALLHAGVLGLSWQLPRAWSGLRALGLTAVAAAVWFVAVQWVSVGAFCRFCMLAHGGALLVLVGAWRAGGATAAGAWRRPAWLAAGALCVLAAGQALSEPPTTHEIGSTILQSETAPSATPVEGRVASYFDGRLRIAVDPLPMLGDRDAEHVIVEVFDYTCSHCRSFAPMLDEALARHEDRLAVALLVCPIDRACNERLTPDEKPREGACEIARLAMAVHVADPAKHRQYHDWLMSAFTDVPVRLARRRAEELVGPEALEAALGDSRIAAVIERGTEIHSGLGSGHLPKLLLRDDRVMVGEPSSIEALLTVLRDELGLPSER